MNRLRPRLSFIPALCLLLFGGFLSLWLHTLFGSYSHLVISRKPRDMEFAARAMRMLEEEETGGVKRTLDEKLTALVKGIHRNTAFLMFKESRKYPNTIIQPERGLDSDAIRKAIDTWNQHPFGDVLYQGGISFEVKGDTYHTMAARQTVYEGSYELVMVTNIDRAVAAEYKNAASALAISDGIVAIFIILTILSLTISVRDTERSVSFEGVKPKWFWTTNVLELWQKIQAYKQEQHLYRTQIEQSTSGHIIVHSPVDGGEATMHSPNNAFCKITGYSREEIEGQPLNLIVPKQYHPYHYGMGTYHESKGRYVGMLSYARGCPFHGAAKSTIVGGDRSVEFIPKDKSSRQGILGVEFNGLSQDSLHYEWFGVLTDVTELSRAKAEAEKLAAETQNITHIFAHDLKAGEGASAKAGEYITETGKDLIEYLKAAGHLDSSVERSLNFIVKYSGRITASCQNNYALIDQRNKLHNLAERMTPEPHLIDEIFDGVRVSFNRSDGKLLFINECPPEAKALVDITMFLTALKNLVKNGFTYNDSIDKQIEVKAKIESDQVLFSVKDNGVGFPREYLENWGKIQGQAARLDPTKDGSGTGLFSVRRIVEAHKGASVSILSDQGSGSTFLIKVGGER